MFTTLDNGVEVLVSPMGDIIDLDDESNVAKQEGNSSIDSTRALMTRPDWRSLPLDECDPCIVENVEEGEEGDNRRVMMTTRGFHAIPVSDIGSQRENIFQTNGKIKNLSFDFIIDSGSETNCISKEVVDTLKLETTKNPKPYKLHWLDDGAQTAVRKQCLINFAIGTFEDTMTFDVVQMDVCHLLLGKHW